MLKTLGILISIFGITISGFSSDSSVYMKGKIYTETDTISCYIELLNGYEGKIRYKIKKEDKKSLKIDAIDIQRLVIATTIYERINYGNGKSNLMKQLLVGEFSMYIYFTGASSGTYSGGYMCEGGVYYGGGSSNSGSSGSSGKLFIANKGKVIKVKNGKIKKVLTELMYEDKDILSEIEDLEPYRFQFKSELRSLLSKYNFWYKYDRAKL